MFKIVSIITVMILSSSFAYGQLAGDECYYPIIANDGANVFDTTFATPSTPEPDESQCPGTELNWNNSQDIWFKYIPAVTGTHSFTTCDPTSYDTSMALYENSCTNQIACNGDDPSGSGGCQGYYSTIEHSLNSGSTYFIRIGGWNGSFGTGTLTIDPTTGSGGVVWYVDVDNTNPSSGTDWASAFTDVQDALDVAVSGDQIWIAEGDYRPTDTDGLSDPREASFRLIAGVDIYGGFQGFELDVNLRRPTQFRVLLTGDLNGDDGNGGDNSENAYHVLTANSLVGLSPILDGVYIDAGNANGTGDNKYGGALIVKNYVSSSNAYPDVLQTRFVINNANHGGAIGIKDVYSGIKLTRCVLANNEVVHFGGAIFNSGICTIDNCLFVANSADSGAGAVYSNGSACTVIGSTIVQNHSDILGGMYFSNGTVHFTNNIIWGNTDVNGNNTQIYLASGAWSGDYNCIQNYDGTLGGASNIDSNPRFVDEFGDDGEPATGDENYQLLQQSPCIDVGDNLVVTVSHDIEGNDRILDDPYTLPSAAIVDMGCYEHVAGSHDVRIWSGTNSDYFYDSGNWLPIGVPDADASTLFNTAGLLESVLFAQNAEVNRMFITEGDVSFNLNGVHTLRLNHSSRALQVDTFDNNASAYFMQGNIDIPNGLTLESGNISFKNIYLNVPTLHIGNGTLFSFGGGLISGGVTNEGSTLSVAGRGIGLLSIEGSLENQGYGDSTGQLVGSMPFDIAGYSSGTSYDHVDVSSFTDMSCSIELRWSSAFTPSDGDAFDLFSVGGVTGQPTVIHSSGLPSELAVRWTTPTPVRSGDEVVVETTGPILFETENVHDLSSSSIPNDIVVADLNGDNYSDVAMSVPNAGGANGNIVILINNGMSGNTWLGFTENAPIEVGINPMDIEVGDFYGDGTANDLVVANNGDNDVSILSNDGSGVFTKTDVATDSGPMYVSVVDFVSNDALGLEDLVVACSSNNASVLQNTTSIRSRSITFTLVNSISIPSPGDILPGDVTTDKDFDVVVLDISNDKVRLMEGNGDGTVASVPLGDPIGNPLPTNSGPVDLLLADLDGDNVEDAVSVNETSGALSVLLDIGDEFGNASTFAIGTSPDSATAFDFDNDNDEDLVVSHVGLGSGDRELAVIRNDTATPGGVVILSEGDTAGSGSDPVMVEHGNFNNDGLEDIAALIDLGANGPGIGIYFNTTAVVNDCPTDIDGDGSVAVGDILAIISGWGTVDPALDIDGSGLVDVGDILLVVSNWGPCS